MDLDDPVYQYAPHFFIDISLLAHVVRRRQVLMLCLKKVLRDAVSKFTYMLGIT